MIFKKILPFFVFIHFLTVMNVYSQAQAGGVKINWKSPNEDYEYKYTYSHRGKYYIHAEEVKRADYDYYIRKCDSIAKAKGIKENMLLESVPELELVAEIAFFKNNVLFFGSGLNITLPVNLLLKEGAAPYLNAFSLNWKVLLGSDNNSDFFFHFNGTSTLVSKIPLGSSGGSNGNSIGVDLLTVISALVPEGISYCIPVGEQFRIVSFLNPLGGDYWKNSTINYGSGTPTIDLGLKPNFVSHKKITCGGTFGYKMAYSDSYSRGFYGGLSLGIQLY